MQKDAAAGQTCIEKQRATTEDAKQKLKEIEKEFDIESNRLDECFTNCYNASKKIAQYKNTISECKQELEKTEQQLAGYQKRKDSLTQAINNHREFEAKNYESIQTIEKNYNEKWKQFESKWNEWNIEQIILYLKYKTNTLIVDLENVNVDKQDKEDEKGDEKGNDNNENENENDVDNVDWSKIEASMKEEKFRGKYLIAIDKSDLKSFGIKNFGKRNEIFKIIKNLCKNNPIIVEKDDEDEGEGGNNGEGQVMTSLNDANNKDQKYLCPLTDELMRDPVIAFDGKCYEKEAIIDYIRKNKQSPITKEKIDDVEWAISLLYDNQSLKQEIEAKFFSS